LSFVVKHTEEGIPRGDQGPPRTRAALPLADA
jgi:hypothetical protein